MAASSKCWLGALVLNICLDVVKKYVGAKRKVVRNTLVELMDEGVVEASVDPRTRAKSSRLFARMWTNIPIQIPTLPAEVSTAAQAALLECSSNPFGKIARCSLLLGRTATLQIAGTEGRGSERFVQNQPTRTWSNPRQSKYATVAVMVGSSHGKTTKHFYPRAQSCGMG